MTIFINDRFNVKRELGRGGAAIAYLAEDCQNDNELVVIKILHQQPNEKTQAWIEQHFIRETRALSKINHPGVVKLKEIGQTEDNKTFFAMEYVDGFSLRSQISPNRGLIGDFPRIAYIIRQLGEAVDAAHQKGVYHRDLKPENIMIETPKSIDEDERVKVIDFGIATVKDSAEEVTQTTQIPAGSVLYMAPEQIENKPSAASDIYALGVIAYEMVTGRTPFIPEAASIPVLQILLFQKEGLFAKPKDLRPSLSLKAQDVILKAISFNPADRYKRANEFGIALSEALTKPSDPNEETLLEKYFSSQNNNTSIKSSITQLNASNTTPNQTLFEEQTNKYKQIKTFLFVLIILLSISIASIAYLYVNTPKNNKQANNKTPQPLLTTISPTPAPIATAYKYKLSYWGKLQPYKNNKPLGQAINLTGGITGETYFNTGDGLQFFVKTSTSGFLYLINESALSTEDVPQYIILFPSPSANKGISSVNADREISTAECIFDETTGTEKVWMIWSSAPINTLEEACQKWSNKQNQGEVKDPQQTNRIKEIINKSQLEKPEITLDSQNETTTLLGKSDVLAYPIKLKHR